MNKDKRNRRLASAFVALCGGAKNFRVILQHRQHWVARRNTRASYIIDRVFGVAAITVGDRVFYDYGKYLSRRKAHEEKHLEQWADLGPARFISLYALSSAWAFIRGKDPYHDNMFEVSAHEALEESRGNK